MPESVYNVTLSLRNWINTTEEYGSINFPLTVDDLRIQRKL